ncbi:GNAT family N-acetyltransferase [Knoellia sp. GCM10027112]
MAPSPDEHLTTGWEPDLPADDTLVRQAVLVHSSWPLRLAEAAGRPHRHTPRWAGAWLNDRGALSNPVAPARVAAVLSDDNRVSHGGARTTLQLLVGEADADLDARLSDELDAFNSAASGVSDQRELTVRVTDVDGGLVAGLSGWTWGTCAGVAMVWVREDCRQQGLGGRMMAAAEEEAGSRGCRQLLVSSFTFQAPGFYERHGYTEIGRSPDLPVEGAADVHFIKYLT